MKIHNYDGIKNWKIVVLQNPYFSRLLVILFRQIRYLHRVCRFLYFIVKNQSVVDVDTRCVSQVDVRAITGNNVNIFPLFSRWCQDSFQ